MSVSNIERFNFSLIQRPALGRGCTSFRISRQVVPVRIRLFGKLFLPMLVVVLFACKSNQSIKTREKIRQKEIAELFALGPNTVIEINEDEEEIHTVVDEMPLYDGKPAHEGISSHVILISMYPTKAQEQGIGGVVLVEFIVVENGSLANVKIIQSAHPILDAEALRVIQALPPKWTPGKHEGKPVKVKLEYPFRFRLT